MYTAIPLLSRSASCPLQRIRYSLVADTDCPNLPLVSLPEKRNVRLEPLLLPGQRRVDEIEINVAFGT